MININSQSEEFNPLSVERRDRAMSLSQLDVSPRTLCPIDWLYSSVSMSHGPVLAEKSGQVCLAGLFFWLSTDTSTAVLLASLFTSKMVFVRSSIV